MSKKTLIQQVTESNLRVALEWAKLSNNQTNSAEYLAAIGFDIQASSDVSNISRIELSSGSSTIASNRVPAFEDSATVGIEKGPGLDTTALRIYDFVFYLKKPVLLLPNDVFQTGEIRLVGNSNGCAAGTGGLDGENVTLAWLNGQYFLAAKTNEGVGTVAGFPHFDLENDQDTAARVGRAAISQQIECQ